MNIQEIKEEAIRLELHDHIAAICFLRDVQFDSNFTAFLPYKGGNLKLTHRLGVDFITTATVRFRTGLQDILLFKSHHDAQSDAPEEIKVFKSGPWVHFVIEEGKKASKELDRIEREQAEKDEKEQAQRFAPVEL